ncbi:MAG: FGGY-family carbohydrate kinase [Nitrososphaerales archaeon]
MTEKMEWLLGIDIGTTAIKVAAYTLDGRREIVFSTKTVVKCHSYGYAEQDMNEIWNKTANLLRILTKKIHAENIVGVGLSGQSGGLWLVDDFFNPIGNGVTWLDLRGTEIINKLNKLQIKEIYDMCGWKIFPGAGPILLKWFDIHKPEILKKARYLLRCKDWVRLKLTNIVASDITDMIGFINPDTASYSRRVFEILSLDEYYQLLPPLKNPWELAGEITREAAKQTGLKEDTPVVTGAYDVCQSALGAGVTTHGQLFAVIGTAGIFAAVSNIALRDPEMKVSINRHCIPETYILNSQSMLATPNIDWFINEFCKDLRKKFRGKNVYKLCDRLVESVKAGSGLIIYHPYLQGEMSPFMNPNARAMFFGLSLWHDRNNLLRAVYEGVGYSMLDNIVQLLRVLETSGKLEKLEEVTIIGGGSKSHVWLQILSNICGLNVKVPSGKELGCRGAAINAGVGLEVFKNHRDALMFFHNIKKVVTPNLKETQLYKKIFTIYRELYERIWDLWNELDELKDVISNNH